MHKIVSNKKEAVSAFSRTDLSKDLIRPTLGQRKISFTAQPWTKLRFDYSFVTFREAATEKPYKRRGIFRVFNSLYDLGPRRSFYFSGRRTLIRKISYQNSTDLNGSPVKQNFSVFRN